MGQELDIKQTRLGHQLYYLFVFCEESNWNGKDFDSTLEDKNIIEPLKISS